MSSPTVEQRIIQEYQKPVPDLLESYASKGMTSKQVAQILDCGVSNVRRIARKYNVRFNQPAPQTTIIHSEAFKSESMNPTNFLCRTWKTSAKPIITKLPEGISKAQEQIESFETACEHEELEEIVE